MALAAAPEFTEGECTTLGPRSLLVAGALGSAGSRALALAGTAQVSRYKKAVNVLAVNVLVVSRPLFFHIL